MYYLGCSTANKAADAANAAYSIRECIANLDGCLTVNE